MSRAARPAPRIGILGAGFSGLCLAIRLKQQGIESFTIFEKADRVGGTWRENTYPGAACDSPSFAYCFSFEPKTDWSRKWSPQPEILAYMEHCVAKYGLAPHIRFGAEIASARFDEGRSEWRLRTQAGESYDVDILVSGVGQLNRPYLPKLPGLERLSRPCFHSAQWDHAVPLAGRSVGVVGNAASAIQFVPPLAREVAKLTIFQRSANWMLPKFDRRYGERERRLYARLPWLARLYRWWIWLSFELRWPVFRGSRWMSRSIEALAERAMRATVKDPRLQDALVPDYPIGGKRILISDDYYETLNRANVEVVTAGIDHVTEGALVDREGREHPVDALILATGFQSTDFLAPIAIEGIGGRHLHEEWEKGAHAYLGISVSGFPNFFMMYGPNTNLGHNSIIFMIECQTRYILDCVARMRADALASIELRQDVMDAYNRRLQQRLARTVWARTGKSWYKNEDGTITNNWCGSTLEYWWRTRRADLLPYRQVPRGA